MNTLWIKSIISLFLVFSITQGAGEYIEVDSLVGLAEVQRAGQSNWDYLKTGNKIYNNDLVRVLDKGFACLKWPDGNVIYMHKNSQMLINLLPRKSNTFLTHSTVFFGAVFFVIKQVLPREFSNDTKVYTPTAVLSIRGTSFLVTVDPETKASTIKMINGTVLAGNIKKNVSIYLSAPLKASIKAETDPIVATSLIADDLDSLKMWVPPPVIDFEVSSHLAKVKREQIILSGKLDDKCIVTPFIDNSGYGGVWVLEKELSRMFYSKTKARHPTMNIAYIDSVDDDNLKTAFKHKARYLITGIIETFDIVQKAEITVHADQYREQVTGRVKIKLEIVDASDKKVISQENIIGEVSAKNSNENTWENLKNAKCSFSDSTFSKSILGLALEQALEQALEKCDATLGL